MTVTTQHLPSGDESDYPGGEMSLVDHLRELRSRLIKVVIAVVITTFITFTFIQRIMDLLLRLAGPYRIAALSPMEKFGSYMKVAFYGGLALAMPVLVYQTVAFISPGLTRKERAFLFRALPLVAGLFLGGLVFGYLVVLPNALRFLLGFGSDRIETLPRLGDYISFVTNFLLAVAISFETPIFVWILIKTGIVSAKRLASWRKYAFLIILIIAAVITPTWDPVNLMIVAIPMYLLFEGGLLLGRIA